MLPQLSSRIAYFITCAEKYACNRKICNSDMYVILTILFLGIALTVWDGFCGRLPLLCSVNEDYETIGKKSAYRENKSVFMEGNKLGQQTSMVDTNLATKHSQLRKRQVSL